MRLIDSDRGKEIVDNVINNSEDMIQTNLLKTVKIVLDAIPTFLFWKNVKDEKPKNVANRVFVYCADGLFRVAHYEGGETDTWYAACVTTWEELEGEHAVTYWTDLEPPKEDLNVKENRDKG